MRGKNLFFFVLILLCLKCSDSKSINDIGDYEDLGKKIKEGDLDAYKRMKILCLDYEPSKIIPWAKYAADTLKCESANLDALEGLLHSNEIYSDTIDLKLVKKADSLDVVHFFKKSKLYNVKGSEKYVLRE